MRVVFLTHNYPRHPGDLAGAFLHPLALALRDRGHDLSVVAPSDGGRGGTDRLDGITVERVRYGSSARERYAYTGRMEEAAWSPAGWLALGHLLWGMRRASRHAVAGRKDAVIHAHWWLPAGLAAPPELPTVVTLHGTDARLLANPVARPLARRALRPGRVVTAVSRLVADAVSRTTGRPGTEIRLTPMPLSLRRARSAGGGGLVTVGRLTPQKRFHLALEAHRRLLETHPSLRLTVIGDGPERPRLEALVRQLGTGDRVTFLGQLATTEVAAAIGDADLCLFPAKDEGLGLGAIEALAVGVPVVGCRDGGGLRDILEQPGAGILVEADPDTLAAAAESLLGSATARDDAARAGEAWRERLAPERVALQFEEAYREAGRG